MSVILAHQGGWDEFLLVAVPIVAIVALLRVAKRRVERGLDASPPATLGHGAANDPVSPRE